jgi:hypothetical protein
MEDYGDRQTYGSRQELKKTKENYGIKPIVYGNILNFQIIETDFAGILENRHMIPFL